MTCNLERASTRGHRDRRRRRAAVWWVDVIVCSGVLGVAGASHAQATFHGLGDLPGGAFYSAALGVSDDGQAVVGQSSSSSDGFEAFRWTPAGGMQGLGFLLDPALPIHSSTAYAVSSDGSVVVGFDFSRSASFSANRAFRWTEAFGMAGLGFRQNQNSQARAVSADGSVIVGEEGDFGGFRWTAARGAERLFGVRTATDVSLDGSVVVGGAASRAVRWTESGGAQILGSGEAYGASADGAVVVGYTPTSSSHQAFRWTAGAGMVGLGFLPGGIASLASDVSGDGGIVVGYARQSPTLQEAFVWDAPNGMRSLHDVLVDGGADVEGWRLTDAYAISADGLTIVGGGVNPDGLPEGWIALLAPSACSNGADDDGDGLVDHPDDPGCTSALDRSEDPECADGFDNDGEGLVDFPADSGCATTDGPREGGECDDGLDNDGDGAADTSEPGCVDPSDVSERSRELACDDGVDNDGDGLIDVAADPGCPLPEATLEDPLCNNGLDDDGDGLTDFGDPVCEADWPYWESVPACGVGIELVAVLSFLTLLRRHRRDRVERHRLL